MAASLVVLPDQALFFLPSAQDLVASGPAQAINLSIPTDKSGAPQVPCPCSSSRTDSLQVNAMLQITSLSQVSVLSNMC